MQALRKTAGLVHVSQIISLLPQSPDPSIKSMSYFFSNGFRLVVPYLDKIRTYVLGSWVGRQLLDVR